MYEIIVNSKSFTGLLTPFAVTIENNVDLKTEENDYLNDYFDDSNYSEEALRSGARVYLIYPYIHDKRPIDPPDFDALRTLISDLIHALVTGSIIR